MDAEQNRGMSVDTAFTDYRRPDNSEYTDDDDSSLSDSLLESPDTMDEPWYQWTNEQKDIMMEHISQLAQNIRRTFDFGLLNVCRNKTFGECYPNAPENR